MRLRRTFGIRASGSSGCGSGRAQPWPVRDSADPSPAARPVDPPDGSFLDHVRMGSILDAIGNTPLVQLRHCVPANGAELWVKLEYCNPSGSMKDRMALAMVEGAERDGLISPGDMIVEYTGGSTGPGLALVCGAKGYRALIVIADCYTEERLQLMRALGAELEVIPSVEGRPKVTPQDIQNMVARAAELADQPRPLRHGSVQQPVHHSGPSRSARTRDLGPDRRPCHGLLPGRRNRELAGRRRRGAKATRRLHPGARARLLCRDRRRNTWPVRDAGLGRVRHAALGPRQGRPPRGDRR